MDWYLNPLKNYFNFSGRARRTEFWMFALINTLIGFLFAFAETILEITPLFSTIYYWFIFIPSWAVLVRRLRNSSISSCPSRWKFLKINCIITM